MTQPDWPTADKAYQQHHAHCPQCRAAGTNPTLQRCPEGQELWATYQQAGMPPHLGKGEGRAIMTTNTVPGISALQCVISSLRDTAHLSDEGGELTDQLRELRDWALSTAAQPPADGALNTIAAMFHSGEEIEGPDGLAMMVDMSVWNDALDAFDEISGDEMEPAHPTAGIWVPTELAERVQETMGEFLMDHGWRQQDMDTSDEFGALLAVATKAEPPTPWTDAQLVASIER